MGDQVTALFREIDVLLAKGDGLAQMSARNRFEGTVDVLIVKA